VGELKPIHRTRHVDIREDKTDFLVQFEQSNGSVGAARFINLEASVLDEVNRPHSDQRLVLHDQNRDAGLIGSPIKAKLRSRTNVQVICSSVFIGLRAPNREAAKICAGVAARSNRVMQIRRENPLRVSTGLPPDCDVHGRDPQCPVNVDIVEKVGN
jgi:hypothetical protein